MEAATFQLILAGLIIATLLVNRGIAVVAAVIALTISIFQPDQVLLEYGFDRDILMAAILLLVLYPIVSRLMHS